MPFPTDAERHARYAPLDDRAPVEAGRERPPAPAAPVLACFTCWRNLAVALHAPGCPQRETA